MYFSCPLSLISLTPADWSFSPNPYTLYSSGYEEKVRSALSKFHVNLSNGKPNANGPMVSADIEWNFNGALLVSRESFVATLNAILATFGDVQVIDQYQVVDGNVGAVLYRLTGSQAGEFAAIEPTGNRFNVMGSELMVFDSDAKLDTLFTIDELDQIVGQISDSKPAPPLTNVSLFDNSQTKPKYRQKLRDNMAVLFSYFQQGKHTDMVKLATPDVAVNADQVHSSGKEAFLQLFTGNQDSFLDKIFHMDYIVADGRLGAVECVWQGTQTASYTSLKGEIIKPTNNSVRVRNNVFFEFNDEALITKVTWVHNEGVIEQQLLEAQNEVLYPLYP